MYAIRSSANDIFSDHFSLFIKVLSGRWESYQVRSGTRKSNIVARSVRVWRGVKDLGVG